MSNSVAGFYDELADYYHLIFEDWDRSIDRQATALNGLLAHHASRRPLRILDCACGIGTQALGLARCGHHVVASDLSARAVSRAKHEAQLRGLNLTFCVSDMTDLSAIPETDFDAIVAMDNALPHLNGEQLGAALRSICSRLRPGGLFLASTRDYDELIVQRPSIQGPVFYGTEGDRRIALQVWDWKDRASYLLHMYISLQGTHGWETHHFISHYRCLLREELSIAINSAGFEGMQWLTPAESGYYQRIALARKSD